MWDNIISSEIFYSVFYIFFLYAFLGWIYESCLVSLRKRTLVNRGFLTGPVIPIYGCGALLVYLALWEYRDNLLLVFFVGSLLATSLEYITSVIMEVIFNTRWWDYSTYRFNFQGRIYLGASLIWGIMSIAMVKIFHPIILFIISKIPRAYGEAAGYVIIGLFTADIALSVIYTVKFKQLLEKLHTLRQDIMNYVSTIHVNETTEELKSKLGNIRLGGVFTEAKSIIDSKLGLSRNSKRENKSESRIKQEVDKRMGEYLRRYQELKTQKIHIRLLKAFPTMRVGNMDMALKDLREKIARKGVAKVSLNLHEGVTGRIKGYLSGFLRVTMVGLLVLAQFILIIYLSYKLQGYTVYIYSFIQVLSVVIIISLINDDRNDSYKIIWICIIAAFPVTGHIMYMLWGNRRRKRIEDKILKKIDDGAQFLEYSSEVKEAFARKYPTKSRMTRYLEANRFPLYKNNKIDYYPMADEAFTAIFSEIEQAQNFVLVNFFIIGEGALWEQFHSLLKRKIQAGVKVLFLMDDFGATLRTPKNFRKDLESEGFEVRVFNPIHRYTDKLYMNYRTHQKIIVVDGNVGFTGGFNLADEYVNLVTRFGVWKDNGIRLEGEAVWGLTVTFLQMWEASADAKPIDYNLYRSTKTFDESDVFCHVISDGPANNPRNPIESIYKQIIYYAKKRLYITTPYLIIEDDMREALTTAARSGVDVRIITPYIPDKKHVKLLTNYNYGRLLEAGVRIFEYLPGFIHAKTIISEDTGIVGTINMDYRSFHLHYECGVWICNNEVISDICDDLNKTMEQCQEITYEEWKNRPLSMKVYQMILNLFATLM